MALPAVVEALLAKLLVKVQPVQVRSAGLPYGTPPHGIITPPDPVQVDPGGSINSVLGLIAQLINLIYVVTPPTVPVMVGATAFANGVAGIVPQPLAGQQTLFLRGDATWALPAATSGAIFYNVPLVNTVAEVQAAIADTLQDTVIVAVDGAAAFGALTLPAASSKQVYFYFLPGSTASFATITIPAGGKLSFYGSPDAAGTQPAVTVGNFDNAPEGTLEITGLLLVPTDPILFTGTTIGTLRLTQVSVNTTTVDVFDSATTAEVDLVLTGCNIRAASLIAQPYPIATLIRKGIDLVNSTITVRRFELGGSVGGVPYYTANGVRVDNCQVVCSFVGVGSPTVQPLFLRRVRAKNCRFLVQYGAGVVTLPGTTYSVVECLFEDCSLEATCTSNTNTSSISCLLVDNTLLRTFLNVRESGTSGPGCELVLSDNFPGVSIVNRTRFVNCRIELQAAAAAGQTAMLNTTAAGDRFLIDEWINTSAFIFSNVGDGYNFSNAAILTGENMVFGLTLNGASGASPLISFSNQNFFLAGAELRGSCRNLTLQTTNSPDTNLIAWRLNFSTSPAILAGVDGNGIDGFTCFLPTGLSAHAVQIAAGLGMFIINNAFMPVSLDLTQTLGGGDTAGRVELRSVLGSFLFTPVTWSINANDLRIADCNLTNFANVTVFAGIPANIARVQVEDSSFVAFFATCLTMYVRDSAFTGTLTADVTERAQILNCSLLDEVIALRIGNSGNDTGPETALVDGNYIKGNTLYHSTPDLGPGSVTEYIWTNNETGGGAAKTHEWTGDPGHMVLISDSVAQFDTFLFLYNTDGGQVFVDTVEAAEFLITLTTIAQVKINNSEFDATLTLAVSGETTLTDSVFGVTGIVANRLFADSCLWLQTFLADTVRVLMSNCWIIGDGNIDNQAGDNVFVSNTEFEGVFTIESLRTRINNSFFGGVLTIAATEASVSDSDFEDTCTILDMLGGGFTVVTFADNFATKVTIQSSSTAAQYQITNNAMTDFVLDQTAGGGSGGNASIAGNNLTVGAASLSIGANQLTNLTLCGNINTGAVTNAQALAWAGTVRGIGNGVLTTMNTNINIGT